jgi:transposase
VLADKAYTNKKIRAELRRRRITAVIPEKKDHIAARAAKGSRGGRPPAFDRELYKQRNVVERAINKLKQFRAVATRYDKREFMYQATVDAATMKIWLRDLARPNP